jgi:lysophospholipase L1-like esterase
MDKISNPPLGEWMAAPAQPQHDGETGVRYDVQYLGFMEIGPYSKLPDNTADFVRRFEARPLSSFWITTADGSHPNDLGSSRMADALEPCVRALLEKS